MKTTQKVMKTQLLISIALVSKKKKKSCLLVASPLPKKTSNFIRKKQTWHRRTAEAEKAFLLKEDGSCTITPSNLLIQKEKMV